MKPKYLVTALLLPLLANCSSLSGRVEFPDLPPALVESCPLLATPPQPLIDPPRLQWEAEAVLAYQSCMARHAETVAAWQDARAAVTSRPTGGPSAWWRSLTARD